MCALNRSIERQFALRDMAVGALTIAHLREVHVIFARGEVDVVVACATSRPAGLKVCRGLGRSGVLLMAELTVARISGISWEHDSRIVGVSGESINFVRRAGLHTGQRGPMWILWIMTLKSTVLPVVGSEVWGV